MPLGPPPEQRLGSICITQTRGHQRKGRPLRSSASLIYSPGVSSFYRMSAHHTIPYRTPPRRLAEGGTRASDPDRSGAGFENHFGTTAIDWPREVGTVFRA